MVKILVQKIIFLNVLFIFSSCVSYLGKIGEPKYPNLEQSLSQNVLILKEKLPENLNLIVYVSETNKSDAEIAEGIAFKIVELCAPKLNVLERQNLEKALEEIEKQSSDLYDQRTTVSLGKIAGAQFMVVPEISVQKNIIAKLYHPEMDKVLIYQKMDLKLKVVELETGKISLAFKNSYWDIAPNQTIEEKYRKPLYIKSSGSRYIVNNTKIIIAPNQPVIVRPVYINPVKQTTGSNQTQLDLNKEERRKKRIEERKQQKLKRVLEKMGKKKKIKEEKKDQEEQNNDPKKKKKRKKEKS